MATHKTNKPNPYDKIERIILSTVYELEDENKRLKESLAIANAKLEVYERLATVSDSKTSLGFGPPLIKDERN